MTPPAPRGTSPHAAAPRIPATLAALALAACTGTVGTVDVSLTTAPGSTVLDAVQRLRLTLTEPRQVVEAERGAGGFALALELDAADRAGAVIVEGFDAAGALVACGQSPVFPVSAINSRVAVYVAAPDTIAASPAALAAARSEVAATALDYGAVLAGGREASGPTSALAIYNAYDHSLISGLALPAPRAGLALATAPAGRIYLFGGTGPDGAPTGTLWRFETTVAPSGAYTAISDDAGFARTGQLAVPIAAERYLITGAPALDVAGAAPTARGERAGLPAVGARGTADGAPFAIFGGAPIVRYRDGAFTELAGDAPVGAAAVTLPDGRVALVGGATRDALIVDGAGAITPVAAALSVARRGPTVAATRRHVLVIGGLDDAGAPIASADLLDAATLAPRAVLPILPRAGGFAIALPNDQILFGGGAPALPTLELFTPAPPALD